MVVTSVTPSHKFIVMGKNLILDLEKIKSESKKMLDYLDDDLSINAYYLLKNLTTTKSNTSNNIVFEKIGNNIIEEYCISLSSQNKSTNTIRDYKREFIRFEKFLKEEKISLNEITIANVEEYLSKRNKKKLLNSSYIKIINCVKSFLKFLSSREYIGKDLASFLKTPIRVVQIKEILSDIDIQKIQGYLKGRKKKYRNENLRDNIIFSLGINCGLRRQEFINLNWEDINFDECSIKIIRSKGGKSRKVYFNSKLKDSLLEYRKLTGYYSGSVNRGSHGKRISKCSLQNIIMKMYRESGIYRANLTLHSLRHTFAERLRRKGVDMNTISKLMGHLSIETTAIYFHSNEEDFKKAVL